MKRSRLKRHQVDADEFTMLCKMAHQIAGELPPEVRTTLGAIELQLCDLGEQSQTPPISMAIGVAQIVGALALAVTGGAVHDDQAFDRFLDVTYTALHVAVAAARIRAGWTPGGPS